MNKFKFKFDYKMRIYEILLFWILFPITLPLFFICNIFIGIHFTLFTQKAIKKSYFNNSSLEKCSIFRKYNNDKYLKEPRLIIEEKNYNDAVMQDVYLTHKNNNITISCTLLKAPNVGFKRWIIVCHGWTENRYEVLYLGWYWLKQGYNVVIYDARGHGSSSKVVTTIGEYEAKDLKLITDYLKDQFDDVNFAFIGHSMGAATILQYLKLYSYNVLFAIVDGGFNTLSNQYRHMVRFKYHLWPCFGIYGIYLFNYIIYGLKPWTVKINKNLEKIHNIPILFTHTISDKFVIPQMTQDVYEHKTIYEKEKVSEIYFLNKGGHAVSLIYNYDFMMTKMLEFSKKHKNLKKPTR